MTIGEIASEIQQKVSWLEANNGAIIHKAWVITAIMSDHDQIVGADRDFALCCGRFAVADQVDRYFRSVKKQEDDNDAQQALPGFECLQKRYVMIRDGEQVIVRIDDMTDQEIDAKAHEHRRMGDGHYRHASELMQYKNERGQKLLASGV